MKKRPCAVRLLCLLPAMLTAAALHAADKLAPAAEASQFAIHETQAGITIAVDPYNGDDSQKVFRVDYLQYNFIPIRVIITNDTDHPLSLDQARILLIPAEGGKENAAEPEDVERRVYGAQRLGTNIPIGPITIHRQGKNSDKKIEKDFDQFGYSTLTVAPHTTNSGFLWYDVQGLGAHPLNGAVLEFRRLRDADGKELFAFDLPLDRTGAH